MGIYRGAGGSGDAVNDASSEALITIQARDAALAAQAAAELARDAAQLAETNAETAETNAETAETNAETAATNAASSASAASTSASNAATSATNAANSATAAQTAETNAETAETNAAASASAASTSASNAATSATNASNSASAAATSATNASNSASAAATSATNAANSATAAQTAQTAAELAETNAETAEANAETAEANAAASASAAATSESNAATSASNAASSASSASTSASNAATSATNAANSATAASTSATNAANSASAALTSENNAASSASAAATSASNAATSATSASNSASAAATSETNAANSASAAATSASNASTSASSAATSATNASNSASAAATSATNASNSASAAATSASNAATSESNAASSASAAAASYDSFDDRYLGAKSSAPTLDNDGNTLLVGALYYDTVSSSMKVWSGSAWLDAYASLSGALLATNNLSDLNNTATARDNLGVEIGVDVQAYDAQLADIAGLTPADNNFIVGNGTNFVTESGSTARTSLGLGSIATQDANNVAVTGGSINGTTVGASTASSGAFTTLSATGDVTIADKIVHSGDTDTAVRFPAADTVTVETSGAERLRITSTGNVGVGLTNPTQKLEVTGNIKLNGGAVIGERGTASAPAYSFSDDTTSGMFNISNLHLGFATQSTERLRIDSSGNVGIGTSSPASNLHIAGTTSAVVSRISATTGAPYSLYTNSGSSFFVGKENSASGSFGATAYASVLYEAGAYPMTFWTNAAERMRIDSSGNVGIGTTSPVSRLDVRGDTNIGTSATPGTTYLKVNNSNAVEIDSYIGTTLTSVVNYCDSTQVITGSQTSIPYIMRTNGSERMRITSGGRVCIGTTEANRILNVYESESTANSSTSFWNLTYGGIAIRNTSDTANTLAGISFLGGSSGNSASGIANIQESSTLGALGFYTGGSGRSNTVPERMRIDSSGNVGIGTGSPAQKLHVASSSATYIQVQNTGNSVNAYYGVDTAGGWMGTSTNHYAAFYTNNTERMRITGDGNVCIGRTSASRKLDVEGNGIFRGFLTLLGTGTNNHLFINNTAYEYALRTADTSNNFEIVDWNTTATRLAITTGGNLQFNSGYGSVATAYGVRAWVNFNGSGTVSIRASGNVSSITDNGTGDYTVNFTNAMPNTNYSVSGSCGRNGSGANANILSVADNTSAPTTSAVRVNTRGDNGTSTDIDLVSVQIFR